MKATISIFAAALLASASMAAPAAAQVVMPGHLTPDSTTGNLTGAAVLAKVGYPTQNCNLTLNITTGPDGVHTGHAETGTLNWGTNTGTGLCPAITVDPANFTIVSYDPSGSGGNGSAIGRLDDLVVWFNGTSPPTKLCDWDAATDDPLDFLIENLNSSGSGVRVTFGATGTAQVSSGCSIDAVLYDTPATFRAVP